MSDIIHLDGDLNPGGVSSICPSVAEGPFIGTEADELRCLDLAGHDGPHVFHVEWTDPA